MIGKASFEPQIVGKHERRFTGFDQKITAMYARGMTIREIQGYLVEMYGTEFSHTNEIAAPSAQRRAVVANDKSDHCLPAILASMHVNCG